MIRIGPLERDDAYGRAVELAHTACEWYEGVAFLRGEMWPSRTGLIRMVLPSLHMVVELCTKALVLLTDSTVSAKNDIGHKALEYMDKYRTRVPIFDKILSVPENRPRIEALEEAWFVLRYGEGVVLCDVPDIDTCLAFCAEMLDAVFALTGVAFLEHHYQERRNQRASSGSAPPSSPPPSPPS